MNVLLVLCHPNLSSFNHALVDRMANTLAEEGHHTFVHDLYAEHFQPVLENEELQRRFGFDETFALYARELALADGVIFVYPDWWGMPPAMLKGWIDRLFRPGIAYEFEGPEFVTKTHRPLLSGKKAIVMVTTNETNPLTQESIMAIWKERVFDFVGIQDVCFKIFYNVREASGRRRKDWLAEVELLVRRWW